MKLDRTLALHFLSSFSLSITKAQSYANQLHLDLENMLVESKVLPESDFRLRQKDRAKARAQESEDKVDDEEYDDWD